MRIGPTYLATSVWLSLGVFTFIGGSKFLGFRPNSLTSLYDMYERVQPESNNNQIGAS